VCFGAIADYGGMRKTALLLSGLVGGIGFIASAGIGVGSWWLGLPALCLTNACIGVNSTTYNAYLAPLVASLPDVRALADRRGASGGAAAVTTGPAVTVEAAATEVEVDDRALVPVSSAPGSDGDFTPVTAAARAASARVEGVYDIAPHPLPTSPRLPSGSNDGADGAAADANSAAWEAAVSARSDELSGKGFAFGYFSGLASTLLVVPVLFFLPEIPVSVWGWCERHSRFSVVDGDVGRTPPAVGQDTALRVSTPCPRP